MSDLLSDKQLQKDFPFLKSGIAYLDNAATTQKPQAVIDAITDYYSRYSASVHRGIYQMSEEASTAYEAVRDQVQQLVGAAAREEIIFTSGTTESLNMIAQLLTQKMNKGDEIILTRLEHHANLIPWQLAAREYGYSLKFLEINDDDELDPADLEKLITEKTKILSFTHVSNVSAYVTPVKELAKIAHQHGLTVVVDAAQSVPHMPVDVVDLDADFLAFSAHKMCGPTGVGVLYGKRELLESLEPVFGGGGMIEDVELEKSIWAELPAKFEPGTPNIAGVIGFGAAIDYLNKIGLENIKAATEKVYQYGLEKMKELEGVTVYGPSNPAVRSSIISFNLEGIHPHDVASVLDQDGVAVRAGHHCAQPLNKKWGVPATVRASVYFYNTREDIDRLVAAVEKTRDLLAK
ncbi:aminotransferase class V-fold PLP-dependent enzyme [Patescibacteria group bacterium]